MVGQWCVASVAHNRHCRIIHSFNCLSAILNRIETHIKTKFSYCLVRISIFFSFFSVSLRFAFHENDSLPARQRGRSGIFEWNRPNDMKQYTHYAFVWQKCIRIELEIIDGILNSLDTHCSSLWCVGLPMGTPFWMWAWRVIAEVFWWNCDHWIPNGWTVSVTAWIPSLFIHRPVVIDADLMNHFVNPRPFKGSFGQWPCSRCCYRIPVQFFVKLKSDSWTTSRLSPIRFTRQGRRQRLYVKTRLLFVFLSLSLSHHIQIEATVYQLKNQTIIFQIMMRIFTMFKRENGIVRNWEWFSTADVRSEKANCAVKMSTFRIDWMTILFTRHVLVINELDFFCIRNGFCWFASFFKQIRRDTNHCFNFMTFLFAFAKFSKFDLNSNWNLIEKHFGGVGSWSQLNRYTIATLQNRSWAKHLFPRRKSLSWTCDLCYSWPRSTSSIFYYFKKAIYEWNNIIIYAILARWPPTGLLTDSSKTKLKPSMAPGNVIRPAFDCS